MSLSTRIRFYVGEYIDALTQYDFQQAPKPWSEFFQKFSIPKPLSSVARRVAINSEYFFANYLRLFLFTLLLYSVIHPGKLILFIFILGLWYLAVWRDRGVWSLAILGYPRWKVSQKRRVFFLLGFTLMMVWFSSLFLSLFIYLGVTCLLVLIHASLRHVTFRAKWNELRLQVMDAW
ncbi:hypothetical protein GAYE_PCTG44G1123 [Galdieria yellowstonensis]|uniref:PRA1 family protein n=1 Tax=Galdieria yellowstonensis TaxID=3028027 RepID=A0AAV9I753_9RHOD|nr:hypothetical protein GAYE_PCTG44G1123 [Galdieria yellowstonensis]